jgi:predicted AlkP superfamily pyrophosphatase or phosphodiesterase
MNKRLLTMLLTLFTIVSLLPAAQPAKSPKLILVIIVDQMRRDYLDRFNDLYGEGGFHLLMEKGARFTECSYPYSVTYTGPGHSVILSGISPASSGIIGNDWYSLALNRMVYCVEDSTATPLDIAPTLTRILNVTPPPRCEGKALTECLAQ